MLLLCCLLLALLTQQFVCVGTLANKSKGCCCNCSPPQGEYLTYCPPLTQFSSWAMKRTFKLLGPIYVVCLPINFEFSFVFVFVFASLCRHDAARSAKCGCHMLMSLYCHCTGCCCSSFLSCHYNFLVFDSIVLLPGFLFFTFFDIYWQVVVCFRSF